MHEFYHTEAITTRYRWISHTRDKEKALHDAHSFFNKNKSCTRLEVRDNSSKLLLELKR